MPDQVIPPLEAKSVRFSPDALEIFEQYKQTGQRNEAGGILIGRVFIGGEVVVSVATAPNPSDRSGRYFFERSKSAAQQEVNSAWQQSNGELIYLGEWHTHPEPLPTPSRRDRAMIKNMFNQTRMEIEFLILVIVGLNGTWVGIQDDSQLKKLFML